MPQVNHPIGNTYETITRPVVFGVAKDCLKQMGFDKKAFLSFKGFTEVALNQNNALEVIEDRNFFGSDTIAEITAKEKPRAGMLYNMSIFRPDELCIFRDEDSNLYLRPVKQQTETEINFKLRFDSSVEANKWRDDIHARLNLLRTQNYHRVVYSFPIPNVYMQFLFDIHKLISEGDVNEEQNFGDYFFKYADKRMTTLTNMNGKDHMPVITETQVRVLGWYNFGESVEEATYDKDSNTWTVEWTYTFIYDKVIECVLYHELVARQQTIPDQWYPTTPYDLYQEKDLALSNSNALADHHLPDFDNPHGLFYNRYPMEDTWFPVEACRQDLRHYTPAFICLTSLLPEDEDQTLVLNLKELGDFDLIDPVLKLVQSDRQYVTRPMESILNISIFSDDNIALPNQQLIDADLNLRATGKLNRKPVYRVVISVIKDMSKLSHDAQDRAKDNACLVKGVLDEIWKAASEHGLIPRPNGRCQWTNEQWEYIRDLLSPPSPGKPWQWGWPPRVPGLELPDGYNPGKWPIPVINPNARNLMSTLRSVALFQVIAKRRS